MEQSLLEKGLNFIPTPKTVPHTPILEAANRFGRNLKLAYHFRRSKTVYRERFVNKSNWVPVDKNMPTEITETINEIENDLNSLEKTTAKSNICQGEVNALKSLSQNPEIIIKPADKGSATVIMDKENYLAEGYRQLGNENHYRKLENPIFQDTGAKINEILDDLENQSKYLSQKQLEYLRPSAEPRPRVMYMLPKIHKPFEKWPFPAMPPGRPIVSDCSSESYAISEYIDSFLQPISVKHDSYVKDTPDFLSKLRQVKVKPDTLLITLDVESMYTNINNVGGLKAVKEAFDNNPDPKRPDEQVLELLKLSLENNDFDFNGDTFLQVSGTAMGKKFAPAYANIFMAKWEKEVLEKFSLLPSFYKRYLDDIYMLWDHGIDAFLEFFEILNSHDPSVKLTYRIEELSNDYLDVTTFKGPNFVESGHLDTKVFFKPTDTHQLLHKSSFHPKHTFSGILKSQILRFYRNCTQKVDFEEACSILFQSLKKRGFSKRSLRQAKSEALQGLKNGTNLTPPYSDTTEDVATEDVDHLASPCGNKICFTCKYVRSCNSVESSTTKEVFKFQHDLNCGSSNIIYLIECEQCGIQYVGETARSLRCRFNGHRFDIDNSEKRPTTVSLHFNRGPCYHNEDLKIIPIFKCPRFECSESTMKARLEIESFFIKKLKTYTPYGLNIVNRKQKDAPAIHLIIPYSALAAKAAKIVKNHYQKLQERMPHVFQKPMITAYSKNKSIKDTLVSAKIR